MTALEPAKLHTADLARTATVGARTRPMRAALSALGIMIGIGAMVAVLGLSESSKSELLNQLEQLGTNLLSVRAGSGIGLGSGELPEESVEMIGRIGPVEGASAVEDVAASVYRNDLIPSGQTGGVTVKATSPDLIDTLGGSMADGVFLDDAASLYPTAVLGAIAAERLGIREVNDGQVIWVGGEWFTVIGILDTLELHADLDRAVLVGEVAAEDYLGHDGAPTTVYVRTTPEQVEAVANVIPATANPEYPDEVEVARPTDALEAAEAADDTLTALFLGLGAVALLVGGVGIANVMVISVLERRSEIGLRRALGATRRHIAIQFLGEASLLSGVGGVAGVALGALVTFGWARLEGWDTLVPPVAIGGGLVAALLIGAIAGLYPATRASRLSPTEALRSE